MVFLSQPEKNLFLQVCHKCLASLGRDDIRYCYTDLSAGAMWRGSLYVEDPWDVKPALAGLIGWDLEMVSGDMLHNWSLGVCRDIVGSAVKVLCSDKHYFPGSTIAKRLNSLFREIKAFARAGKHGLCLKRFSKNTVQWEAGKCPELHAKGADAIVILRYLADKVMRDAPPRYPGMVAALYGAEAFTSALAHAGFFLSEQERNHIYGTGWLFATTYVKLAAQAQENSELLWKLRPKFHFIVHMLLEVKERRSCRNPMLDSTEMDEDLVKQAMRVKRGMSVRSASINFLRRFLVVLKQGLLLQWQKLDMGLRVV